MTWLRDGPQGFESRKIRWEIVPWTRGRGLDIGCGREKAFPHFIGLDSGKDENTFQHMLQKDTLICEAGDLTMFASGSMDFAFSSHLLEHFHYDDVPFVLKEWMRVIKKDGFLVLYLPDEDEYPKVGEDGSNSDHKWNVNQQRVLDAMPDGFDLIDFQKRNQDDEYSLYFVFKKVGSGRHLSYRKVEKPRKTAGVIRYGAFGDLLQASSVLAGLKRQGYHVTLFSSPPGCDVIRHDPNIDRLILQDKDQVPNAALGSFWTYWKGKFDHFVNLSESVEGTFLAMPGRIQHEWNAPLRHKYFNVNYLEHQHALASVPHRPAVRFYPTEDERKWAKKERARMGDFCLMWALGGSSLHKHYPYLDELVARLMISYSNVHVLMVGGPECAELEAGWEKEARVHQTSGKYSIRQTLTMLEYVDAVTGGETGVLNAAANLPLPKVLTLSHSTHENLTRDWVNTIALYAEDVTCPGRGRNEAPACHQMHYSFEHCKRGELTGTAECQEKLHPALVWDALQKAINDMSANKSAAYRALEVA